MIIVQPILSFKRMVDTFHTNYVQSNKAYESCNGIEPSVKIKTKNTIKALGLTIATDTANSIIA